MKQRKRKRKRVLFGAPSAKDFAVAANILCKHGASQGMVDAFTTWFASQNPRFNRERFVAATRSCKR